MHAPESGVCAASVARGKVVAEVRKRTAATIATWISDQDSVQIALAASLRSHEELLEFLLKPTHAKKAVAHAATLALSSDEFRTLFGATASNMTRTSDFQPVLDDADFKEYSGRVASAMRCSLGEQQQAARWKRPISRASCVIGLHMDDFEERLADVLGGVVRGDSRRLEDIATVIDDTDVSTVMLSRVVAALSSSVT